jgi:hypothetical protein
MVFSFLFGPNFVTDYFLLSSLTIFLDQTCLSKQSHITHCFINADVKWSSLNVGYMQFVKRKEKRPFWSPLTHDYLYDGGAGYYIKCRRFRSPFLWSIWFREFLYGRFSFAEFFFVISQFYWFGVFPGMQRILIWPDIRLTLILTAS